VLVSRSDVVRSRLEAMAGTALPEYHLFERAETTVNLDPHEVLFDVGVRDRRLFFVIEGVLSIAIIPPNGRESIRRFAGVSDLISAVPPLGHPVAAPLLTGATPVGSPSALTHYRARAITRAKLKAVDSAVFWELAGRHRAWHHLALLSFLASVALHEKRERELLTLSAEERYLLLVAERPELLGRVPQKDLARYIGVTPVAMSRIVARIRSGAVSPRTREDLADAATRRATARGTAGGS